MRDMMSLSMMLKALGSFFEHGETSLAQKWT